MNAPFRFLPPVIKAGLAAALLLCAVCAEGASLSIYYNDGGSSYTYKSFATGTSGNSLQGTGLIGTASDAGDRWILDIAGGNLNGRITTTSAVDIYLNGNTVVLSNTKSGYAIRGDNGVRVAGPGVLHIDQWSSSTAVSSAKTITFSLGAVVGINNLDGGTAVSGNGIQIIGASVHVNAADGYAFYSESDGFTISASIVSAISTKECVRLRDRGPLSVSASSVHLLSTDSSAIRSGSDLFLGGESVLVSSSVFCAAGSEHGIKFHDNTALLSFDNVIGAVLGRKCGVADARKLFIDGGATKLVFAGNTKGEYSMGGIDAVSLLEDDASSGQAIWLSGSRSYFELDAGSVKLFAPRNVGLSVATNVVAGGSLRVESNPTYGDFQAFFTAAGIVSAAETVAGGLAFGSDILFADIDLAQALSAVCTASDALFGTDGSKTSVGLSQRVLFVLDGSVFVSSGGTGISMGKDNWDYGYRDEAIYYQSAGSVAIESDGLALADLGAIEGNTSFKEDESLFLLTGGRLSAKGRLDGILTCGGLLMKGGTLEAAATGGFAAGTISSAPGLRGYALSANNGFVIEGGSFVATAGKVRTPPYTTSGGGQTGGGQAVKKNYTISFKANGGSGTMPAQTVSRDATAKLRKNAFTRKGYVFLGWAKSKSGAVAYKNAASVKNLAAAGKSMTLYAKWAKKTYKVAFYANGGKGKMAAQTMTYGKAKKLSANKFKAPKGKKFAGWAKSKALAKKGKVAYKNKKAVKNLVTNGKTVKLYAVWKKK